MVMILVRDKIRDNIYCRTKMEHVEASTSESSSVDIPTLVMVDNDELSDISSLYHENDEDRLVTFVSAIMHCLTLSRWLGSNVASSAALFNMGKDIKSFWQ
jgi:hypothetical protein